MAIMSDHETTVRLARMEALLMQMLHEQRCRRRTTAKRTRSIGDRTLHAAMAETKYKPTDLEIAAARRISRQHK